MRKVVWVTGVAGFTGQYLIDFMKSLPDELILVGVDILPSALCELDIYYQVDLGDISAIRSIAESTPPDMVFHLAGLLPPRTEAEMWKINVGGTLNLIQALGQLNLTPRIVSVGSAAEYLPTVSGLVSEQDPCPGYTSYGRVKWGQSSLAFALGKQYGIDVMVPRPFNLIGPKLPRTLVAAQFCEQFARKDGQEIMVGNIKSARDFIDVRDAVAAYWQLIKFGKSGEVYNVCRGVPIQFSKLLDIFFKLSDGMHKVVVDQARLKSIDANSVYGTFGKLREISGWEPQLSLERSLTDMYNEASA